jgi:hypothetical protein
MLFGEELGVRAYQRGGARTYNLVLTGEVLDGGTPC